MDDFIIIDKKKYWYLKKIYKGYCVVFVIKGKYKTCGIDKWMIKYVKKNLVSYVIVDSKFNVKVVDVKNNRYRQLLCKLVRDTREKEKIYKIKKIDFMKIECSSIAIEKLLCNNYKKT